MAKAARRGPSKHKPSSRKPPAPVKPTRGHRPAHEPTDRTKQTVTLMIGAGIGQDDIADCLGIAPKTLRTHYRVELATSYAKIKADIAGKLINYARGDQDNPKGSLKAQMFYLETHGWMRSDRLVVKDEPPLAEEDLTALSDAEISERLTKLRRMAAVTRARRDR